VKRVERMWVGLLVIVNWCDATCSMLPRVFRVLAGVVLTGKDNHVLIQNLKYS
jgi:hypothetical protein